MNDNDILKALECCTKHHYCTNCPLRDNNAGCITKLMSAARDIINRQKTEIERLQKDCADTDNFARDICKERMLEGKPVADFEDLQKYMKKKRAEAIKEFAERVKATFPAREDERCTLDDCYTLDIIDNLVEEMTEEAE